MQMFLTPASAKIAVSVESFNKGDFVEEEATTKKVHHVNVSIDHFHIHTTLYPITK